MMAARGRKVRDVNALLKLQVQHTDTILGTFIDPFEIKEVGVPVAILFVIIDHVKYTYNLWHNLLATCT